MKKLLLIDGHSMLNRAFYGLPDLTNDEGVHTGAVYGFLNIMLKTIEEEKPDGLAVAFDVHAPTFRHRLFADYKGTRKPMPEELRQQVPLIQETLETMGIVLLTREGYEADDILGTMARRGEEMGMEVTILSGDRDLLQLATEKVKIRMPKTAKGKTIVEDYHAADVLEKYQVTPAQIIELKALMGDASDNIPGLPGVGEKTATKILLSYGTIENAHEHLEEIKPNKAKEAMRDHYDLAVLSKTLATINTDSPIDVQPDELVMGDLFTDAAYAQFQRLNFKNLLGRFGERTRETPPLEDSFYAIEEREGMEALLDKLEQKEAFQVGLSLIGESPKAFLAGLAVAGDEIYTYAVTEEDAEWFSDRMKAFSQKVCISAMDLKAVLKLLPLPESAKVFDVGIASYLLNPLKGDYPYQEIAKAQGLGTLPSREELTGKAGAAKLLTDSPGTAARLAGYEAYVSYACRVDLEETLLSQDMWDVYQKIELPLVFVLDAMEKAGIRVKGEELKAYGEKLCVRMEELETAIYAAAGEAFNLNSPKQLGVILFEKLGLSGGKKTKTGYSTAADVLEKLAADQPIVKDILEYRQLAKLKSTYADGLVEEIASDGRIHSTFNQTITATGRISSTEPNLQNIPVRMELGRLIRKVFVPDPGYVFLDADYSQIELRVLAHLSGDEKLIQAYREAQDIHSLTASQVFHVPIDEVTPLMRRNAKAVNFGIVYGISSFGLSQDLSITRKEAQEYIEGYFRTYPGIKNYLDGLVAKGKADGYVTTMFGRRRPIPELSSGNFMTRSFGERVAMNSPIQGTAADIIKIAMIRVYQRLKEEGLSSRLILQVHDELLIETKTGEVETVRRILREEMMGAADLAVELVVDMNQGENWYEAK